MEQTLVANVTYLPGAQPVQDAGDAEKGGFDPDFTLAGIWRKFGDAILPKKQPSKQGDTDAIKGLEMACKLADDEKRQDQIRKEFVKAFFMQDTVKQAIARFFLANGDRPREDQVRAITVLARFVRPGMSVNLRELETQVAEAAAETISKNYTRENLIPLMKEIGLIIQPQEGVNGWQWRDMDKKGSLKELTQKALRQAALMASPAHKELVDEQARRYALFIQEKALKQRLALEKANQQLIVQAQKQADENEKAMVAMGMKQNVSNLPAWIAAGGVGLLAAIWLVGQNPQSSAPQQPAQQAAVYEDAPAYNQGDAESILRQQYKIAHMDWDKLPEATRRNILKEFNEQRNTMGAGQ